MKLTCQVEVAGGNIGIPWVLKGCLGQAQSSALVREQETDGVGRGHDGEADVGGLCAGEGSVSSPH